MSMPTLTADATFGLDPYGFAETHLSEPARAALGRLQDVLDRDIRPLLADAWETASMPSGILDALIPLDLMRPEGVPASEADSSMFSGFRNYVLARTDASVATLYNAQSGLFRSVVALGGSPAQAAELDPRIASFEVRGAFALTEPDHGSDIARGLATTARRDGDAWVIDGEKKWIGGAAASDLLAVFARDLEDDAVKAFLIPTDAAGVALEAIGGKVSLRPMQNALIRIDGARVAEASRLQGVNGWHDVSRILRAMRSDVAWIAAGLQGGALEAAVRYVSERRQFGRPLSGFQLARTGEDRADARQCDVVARHGGPAVAAAGTRRVGRRELRARQDAHGAARAGDRRARARSARRQRHPPRARRRAVLRRRRSRVLL